MDRAAPLAAGFLVGVCVFAWLAGPVLEARFGAEALLVAYGSVAVGAAGITYVLIRRIEARLGDGTVTVEPDSTSGRGEDDETGTRDGTVTVDLDELEDLDVEREVRQLKAEGSSSGDDDDV